MNASFVRRTRTLRTALRARHDRIVVILAPPRTSSTALVRVFWRHPEVGFYNNEPFDRYYHHGAALETVLDHLAHSAVPVPDQTRRRALLVKEMTFQAGQHLPILADLATGPLVFVLRDPRLSIASRMRMMAADGKDPVYPHWESGWEALYRQVAACRAQRRPYVLVDAQDFRSVPKVVLPRLFAALGMSFDGTQVRWRPAPGMRMGNLAGAQDGWYVRVLGSNALERPDEDVPSLDTFPVRGGFRAHVERALEWYAELRSDPRLVTAAGACGAARPPGQELVEVGR